MPPKDTMMVRWIDGFYGGLIAGVMSAIFHALVSVAWLHDMTLSELFAQVAQALPPFHGAPPSWALVGLGVVLWLLVAVAFGILYALLARHVRSMWRAPGSVVWGLCYGLLVWWLINDVAVPVSGAVVTEPLWVGLLGTVLFYGVLLSEATTMALRRRRLDLSGPGVVL
ncbi:MAG TPA: hypothetical protein VK669_02710 [Candidatus Limnocylindrales bacterium]|nr:hypothetical protein [Candidatus Limnocylindrales bacterium]